MFLFIVYSETDNIIKFILLVWTKLSLFAELCQIELVNMIIIVNLVSISGVILLPNMMPVQIYANSYYIHAIFSSR